MVRRGQATIANFVSFAVTRTLRSEHDGQDIFCHFGPSNDTSKLEVPEQSLSVAQVAEKI